MENPNQSTDVERRPHILAIPFPLMGHMTPLLQLCRMLIAMAGCRVTIVCSERALPWLRRLLPENQLHDDQLQHHFTVFSVSDSFPVDLGPIFTWDTFRSLMHAAFEGMPGCFAPHIPSFSDVACVISDTYLSWAQDVANQLGIPRVAIWVSAATEHQVYFHATELIKAGKLPFKAPLGKENTIDKMNAGLIGGRLPLYHRVDSSCEGEEEDIHIPGLPGLKRREFPSFLQIEDSSDEIFYMHIEHMRAGSQASVVLFNSFEALEGTVLDAMQSQGIPAQPIGPLFLLEDSILGEQVPAAIQGGEQYQECLKWLDGQQPKSVMYVAFGTSVQLGEAQVRELALGLLESGQPFIWVYNSNPGRQIGSVEEEDAGASGRQQRSSFLPEGFMEEVMKGRGLLLEWAPQRHILRHPSTGGFLTHCGWNSSLESICSGVPTLGLPFFSDQPLHCKMMVDEWKVGLRLERKACVADEAGVALADDIARLTRELLLAGGKGDALRRRAQEFKLAAHKSTQSGGCSRRTLDTIINLIK